MAMMRTPKREMQKSVEGFLKAPYARILMPESDGSYVAEILEFPGCVAQGETAQEALNNLEAAAKSWVEAALAQGQQIPEPMENSSFSGRLAVRLPRSLHRQAARVAQRDGTSLNQFVVTSVAARVGAEGAFDKTPRAGQWNVSIKQNISQLWYMPTTMIVGPTTQIGTTTQIFSGGNATSVPISGGSDLSMFSTKIPGGGSISEFLVGRKDTSRG